MDPHGYFLLFMHLVDYILMWKPWWMVVLKANIPFEARHIETEYIMGVWPGNVCKHGSLLILHSVKPAFYSSPVSTNHCSSHQLFRPEMNIKVAIDIITPWFRILIQMEMYRYLSFYLLLLCYRLNYDLNLTLYYLQMVVLLCVVKATC